MHKQYVNAAAAIVLGSSLLARAEDERIGVFSNEAHEFSGQSLVVLEDGHALLSASVAVIAGEWTYDSTKSLLTLNWYDFQADTNRTLFFKFVRDKRTYILMKDKTVESKERLNVLHFITNAIPDQLIRHFQSYSEEVNKAKRRAEMERATERKYEDKLRREEPEYQRLLLAITADPRFVLSTTHFYTREDTPYTRAFRTSLGDRDITFPEKVLTDLMETMPRENHWSREQLFARPELSSSTIEKFYPRALEWGAHLNYNILKNLATHSNTPMRIVEDLAMRGDLPGGAVTPAQRRLRKLVDDTLAGHADISVPTFSHLYDLALQMPDLESDGQSIIAAMARSSKTPTNILVRIANSSDRNPLYYVISNPKLPREALVGLTTNPYANIQSEARRELKMRDAQSSQTTR